ncbi:MAG: phospholipase D-like domain-containing protein [Candidatus Aerophobetes bacterium]|nr:phospholipase D-like domain-containing protein [Candidatus Aerophobetes bacterium]
MKHLTPIKWIILLLLLSFPLLFFLRIRREKPQKVIFPEGSSYIAYFSPQDHLYPHLIYLIKKAKTSIYAAFYKIELKEVARALVEAHKRGVKVKIFADDLTSEDEDSQFSYLKSFGLIRKDGDPESFMHHKFCLIDEELVWAGSFNPTPSGSLRENNNVVVIKSSPLTSHFIEEFNRLWEGDAPFSKNKVEAEKLYTYKPQEKISVNGAGIEVYFSLLNNPEKAIIEELRKAKRSIHFALFSFTSPEIAHLLIHKYAENIEVKGIMEKDQDSFFSRYHPLKKLKMEVRWDKNFYLMHHKFFIIDGEVVITGSFNPTRHANYKNREDLLIIHSLSLARRYEDEFQGMWKKWYE